MKKEMLPFYMLFLCLCVFIYTNAQDGKQRIQAGGMANDDVVPAGQYPSESYAAFTSSGYPGSANRIMTVVNFDDVQNAPVTFASTYPLHDEYEGYGIYFEGPGDGGGALLDEGAGFPVTGYSPPNFLAFNTSLTMANGGIPQGPEHIFFNPPVSYVEILAGCADAGTVDMFAYDEEDNLLDFDQIVASGPMQLLTVTGERIEKVTIQFTGNILVLDDLSFNTYLAPDDLEVDLDSASGYTDLSWMYATINGVDEEFEDDARNWIPVTGSWYIDPGFYIAESEDFYVSSSFYNHDFSGFDLEVKMKKNAGGDCNYGIFFHGDPSRIGANGNWMDTYQLHICNNGSYNIGLYQNNSFTYIQGWTTSPNLNTGTGTYNTVRIIRSAGYIEVYFNGMHEGTWFDNTFTSGKIGLKLYDDALTGQGVYDYVTIDPVTDGFAFREVHQPEYRESLPVNSRSADCQASTDAHYTLEPAPMPVENPYTHYDDRSFQHFNVYMNNAVTAQPSIVNHSLTFSDFGVYYFFVTAMYDEGESESADHEIIWWLEDPLYTQLPPVPANYINAYTSDVNSTYGYLVYDNFFGVTDIINGVEFLAFNMEWVPPFFVCDNEDPMDFDIKLYEDDACLPGAEVASFSASIHRIETGLAYTTSMGETCPLYLYRYYFPDPVELEDGWISIQGTSISSPDCYFMWFASSDGDNLLYQWDGNNMVDKPHDVSFALLGGWVPQPPSNLQASLTQATGRVVLTWQYSPSQTRAFQYYKIYRDGVNIDITLNTGYEDFLPDYGSYDYEVTAYYDEGESDPAGPVNVNWSNVGIAEDAGEKVRIYPNPADGFLYIESGMNAYEIAIYNHFGQEVYRRDHAGSNLKISTSPFARGVYLVRLSTGNTKVTRKVMVR